MNFERKITSDDAITIYVPRAFQRVAPHYTILQHVIGFREACHGLLDYLQIFYIEFRRAAASPDAVGQLFFSGKLVHVDDRHILKDEQKL